MKARVRFFARLSELAETRETEVEVGEGLTVADLFATLCSRFPGLSDYEGRLLFAVNAEYVQPSYPLRGGEEVALIPPVSGGADAV